MHPQKCLGVDICNTIAGVNYQIGNIFNIKQWNPKHYGLTSLGIPKKDVDDFFVQHPEVFSQAKPLDGAKKALHNLARHWQIFYITSRPLWAQDITLQWLKQHGFPFGTLIMGIPKPKVVRELKITAFVEDDPLQVQTLKQVCQLVYSPKWAYNSGQAWPEIQKLLMMQT